MDRKLVGATLLLLLSGGCRACNSCCDHLPPVPDGAYPHPGGRAGSAFGVASEIEAAYETEIINPALQALPEVVEQ